MAICEGWGEGGRGRQEMGGDQFLLPPACPPVPSGLIVADFASGRSEIERFCQGP